VISIVIFIVDLNHDLNRFKSLIEIIDLNQISTLVMLPL